MAKTVVITGTSTGIGRACVERMAGAGWTVYAGVRRAADGDDLAAAVVGDVRPVLLDVTDPGQLLELVERLRGELGGRGLNGLVNNAGVAQGGPIEALSDEDWQWHFDVNVFGVVRTIRELLPLLRSARGRVVNIGSVSGRVGPPMMGPYAAGKHAVEAISESLRFEVADQGIQVACVEPGAVTTPIWSKADDQLERIESELTDEVRHRYSDSIDMVYGMVSDGATKGVAPAKVADAVHHALTARRPRHRYLVGPDAKLVGVVTRLPDRLRAAGLRANVVRWQRSGRPLRAKARSGT